MFTLWVAAMKVKEKASPDAPFMAGVQRRIAVFEGQSGESGVGAAKDFGVGDRGADGSGD
ncbi:hypothetical protein [Phormidium sp. CCY1219]|uniref:hypothetical protein n=1 Tax=Phormidium sp. CCY1219 TaxID=2886104 RepID=UPI002D1EE573|nr:hypothetical protein [Phormidium sp. CCY1219]MEB3827284.1 hypothetical protein [Phormidium sp. CCY1219]